MRITLSLWLLGILAAGSGMAQEPPPKPESKATDAKPAEPLPTVDEVLNKFIEASGGKAAIEKVTSRQAKGTFEIAAFGASGTLQSYAKAPNKTSVVIDIPGFGVVEQGTDGTIAWEKNPQLGLREITGAELVTRKRDADFHKGLHFKELYSKLEIKAKEKVGDREVFVLEATPTDGSPDKMYFDCQTGLLIRTDAERESPQGKALVQSFLEDYREVDGVKIPFAVRVSNPAFTFQIKLEEVKHNLPIEDEKFNKPAPQ